MTSVCVSHLTLPVAKATTKTQILKRRLDVYMSVECIEYDLMSTDPL